MRRLVRALSRLGLLGAVAALAYKVIQRRSTRTGADPATVAWPPLTEPEESPSAIPTNGQAPPVAKESGKDEVVVVGPAQAAWVEPDGEGCPPSHPVKAKLTSGVFHLPGMMHYDRTKPDRCYPDAASAEADGLRQAKR